MTVKEVRFTRVLILVVLIGVVILSSTSPVIGDVREVGNATQLFTPRGEWETSNYATQPSIKIYKEEGVYGLEVDKLTPVQVKYWSNPETISRNAYRIWKMERE